MARRAEPTVDRQGHYRRGQRAESIAAAYLMARGHRILARRFKTGAGEIDLIAVKSGRVAFIEVKRRATLADCEASITPKLRYRVRAAANLWMAQNPRYQSYVWGFDLVFIRPWAWPIHVPDSL